MKNLIEYVSKLSKRKADKLSPLAKGRLSIRGANKKPLCFDDARTLAEYHFLNNSSPDHPCRETLTEALLGLGCRPATIIETGSSAWGTNSSHLFDYYVASFGGEFLSVDIRLQPAITLRGSCSENSTFYCDDSINFLKKWAASNPKKKIDLLYLDSWDLDLKNPNPSQIHGLGEFLAASANLKNGSLLLVDDTPLDQFQMDKVQPKATRMFREYYDAHGFYPGKGALIKHVLQAAGRGKQLAHTYQLLWQF